MGPGTTLVTLLLVATSTRLASTSAMQRSPNRSTVGVRLPGGHMEVVKESGCSDKVLRLTCRSLKAFVFVIEAEYRMDRTELCGYDLSKVKKSDAFGTMQGGRRVKSTRRVGGSYLRGNYVKDWDEDEVVATVDLRTSLNRRCSGHHHCRFSISSDHPGARSWTPANLYVKYACIPEFTVRKYCNAELTVPGGLGGYLKSPGYPLYYPGGGSCGWTFEALPGQRISLIFHDLNIRGYEPDGSCVDVVRIRENGSTLFESCDTVAGVRIVSVSNVVTLDLVASARFYPARGFFLQYQVLGCPDVSPPNGSYASNGTVDTRIFLCRAGTRFPDTRQRSRTLHCKGGRWNESAEALPDCVATSALILKSERDNRISSLSDDVVGAGVIIGRDLSARADSTDHGMDSAQPAMIKQADYVVDIVLPTVLIALLFVGNAVIVYIIFQYRKRKTPAAQRGEEMAMKNAPEIPQV